MSNAPLMPMATAVWLVENTTLTFKQISDFCKLHEVEVQGIADGEVAKGIKAYNPIISGQLSREEIELSSKDQSRPLEIKNTDIEISNNYFSKFLKLLKTLKNKPNILFTSSGAVYGKNTKKSRVSEREKIDIKAINNFKGYKKKYAKEKLF